MKNNKHMKLDWQDLTGAGLFLIGSLVLFSFVVLISGCGKSQDPLKDRKYEPVKQFVPTNDNKKTPQQETRDSLFALDFGDSLTFTEDSPKSVPVKFRSFFTQVDSIKYHLVLKSNELEQMGLKLRPVGSDQWVLDWNPKGTIFSDADENVKTINFGIQLVLDKGNSEAAFNEMAGMQDTRLAFANIVKDQTRPIVESVEVSPSATLNANQTGLIKVVVALKTSAPKNDVRINFLNGPEIPSKELAQVDGTKGLEQRPKLIAGPTKGKDGLTRFTYEVPFNTQSFFRYAMDQVRREPNLMWKMKNGDLTQVEAQFEIEAFNAGNRQPSQSTKAVIISVNIKAKAAPVELRGNEVFALKNGGEFKESLTFTSNDEFSRISVNAITVLGERTEMKPVSKSAMMAAQFKKDDLGITLQCGKGTPGQKKEMGCQNGDCFQVCYIHVESGCEATHKSIPVKIETTSALGKESEDFTKNITLNFNGQIAACTGGNVAVKK